MWSTTRPLHQDVKDKLVAVNKASEAIATPEVVEHLESVTEFLVVLEKIEKRCMHGFIFDNYINPAVPRFGYFDDYYHTRGVENIEGLLQRA